MISGYRRSLNYDRGLDKDSIMLLVLQSLTTIKNRPICPVNDYLKPNFFESCPVIFFELQKKMDFIIL